MASTECTAAQPLSLPAARIAIDGARARRIRREALYEFAECADLIKGHLPDDVPAALELRDRLGEIDDLLTSLGWDREIDDDESIELVSSARVLADLAQGPLVSATEHLNRRAEAEDFEALSDARTEVDRWLDVIEQIQRTTGEDL